MTWAKIDDRLHGHPKARRAGLEAMGMWAMCLSFCAAYNTDGQIGRADVEAIGGRRAAALAAKLVEAGLWTPTDDGWTFHDFLAYNPSAAQVEAERKRKAEAGRRGGLAKAASAGKTPSYSLAGASTVLPEAALLPSRPDPGSGSGSANLSGPRSTAGARGEGLTAGDGPDLLALAATLRDEGVGLGESVCERAAKGWKPTPGQLGALQKIHAERAAKGQPLPVPPGAPPAKPPGAREPTRAEVERMLADADRDKGTMSPAAADVPPAPAHLYRPRPGGVPNPQAPQANGARVDVVGLFRGGR